tara:strand:- start:120 stop:830 length:711 start_codon:yes stop_codon:yes gene_type:complete
MWLKNLIKKKIQKKLRKFLKITPEYAQEERFLYYKSLGIKFDKVLDIGAYLGTWKDMFEKIFPESRILMIEANKEKEEILKKKGEYLIALLGARDGELVDYFKCTNENISSGNSVFEENTSYQFNPEKRKAITLSTLLKDQSEFDLIKIDTQGSELNILKGGIEIVKKSKFLLLELSIVEYNSKAPKCAEVIKYLEENDFVLIDICDLNYRNKSLIQIDGFFVNKKFESLAKLLNS